MRLLTGDECGLLKEVVPELCRPDSSHGAPPSAYAAVHSGRARPSATSIQMAAAAYANHQSGGGGGGNMGGSALQRAVTRLEPSPEAQRRERGVVALAFVPPAAAADDDDTDDGSAEGASGFRFAALRTNGTVETWTASRQSAGLSPREANITAASYRKVGELAGGVLLPHNQDGGGETDGGEAAKGWHARQPVRPIGMASNYTPNYDHSQSDNPILAACDSVGTLSLLDPRHLSRGVVATYRAFDVDPASSLPHPSSSKNGIGKGTLSYTRGRFANNHIAACVAIRGGRVAVGGRERGVRVLDLETGKLLWKAKNLPPDPQTLLQQPLWTTALHFLQTPTAALHNSNEEGNLLATGTAYKQVQIYDVRHSSATRRPVLYTPEGVLDHRTTAMCQLPDGHTLAVGDAAGDIHLLDVRKMHSGKQFTKRKQKAKEEIGLGRLVGPGGAIRELRVHPSLPVVACVGLDRKLWTWDVNRRKMTDCVYLKQRLNCLLVCDDGGWDDGEADNEESNEVYEGGGEMGSGRTLEEDAVEDYVDSDDEGGSVEGGGDLVQREDSGGSSGETASDSEDDDASEGSEEDEGSTSEEEEPAPAVAKSKKRRVK
ncbi:hypothetical protein ACHAXT_001655 [Thalassiosira profunda]